MCSSDLGAHNAAGANVLAAYLEQQQVVSLRLVIGMKADKRINELLLPLLPFVGQVYATRPPVDESIDPGNLVRLAEESGVLAAAYADPQAALAAARRDRQPGQVLLVAGSLFLVAAVREQLLPATDLLSISDF